ncbi:hypothetical protein GCM10010171_29990 [Actinokineospora fastidiosa]|uniref:Uncharacterized protein n=1 Tax=Actinokineospora fastidiosa TaxID=1816 RepID=A0A918LD48_9PSEU|nr:hypothetical protein GCM10010171_29990 [Actinokineospora fastidiosa]
MSGARAEIVKLARLLGDPPERFAYLADLPAEDIRELRERATDVLFDANAAVFERIAAASRLVPAAITAAIAQRAFGPLLCARVAGVLEPERAVDLAARVSPSFLADVAAELDPRRVAAILATLPVDRMRAVAVELIRRGDYVTMGRFIGVLPAPALRALVTELSAPDMLHTAVYSDDDTRFAEIFAMVPDTEVPAVVTAAVAAEEPLASDIFTVLTHLDATGLSRLSAEVDRLPEDSRATIARRAAAVGLVDLA